MFNKNPTKTSLFPILCAVFCACLLISNILAAKTFTLTEQIILPCAVIIFPIVYIVNDVLAEIYGFKKARQVIFLGFLLNLLAVISYNIAILLPAPVFYTGSEAFATILGNTFRVLVASFLAYLLGSLINSYTMVRLKEKAEKYLFFRCIFSTLLGEGTDALLFISIAFYGTMPLTALITMIIAQALFKTGYEIVIYPVTRKVITSIRKLPV